MNDVPQYTVKQYMRLVADQVRGSGRKTVMPIRPVPLPDGPILIGAQLTGEQRLRYSAQLLNSLTRLKSELGETLGSCANFGESAYPLFAELHAMVASIDGIFKRMTVDAIVQLKPDQLSCDSVSNVQETSIPESSTESTSV